MTFFDSSIITLIHDQALSNEQNCIISADVLRVMADHKLFKLFVPEQLGGRMLPFPDAIRLFEEAAQIDGSFGWLVSIGAGGGYFSAFYDPAVAKRLFKPAEAVVAGSGHPTGIAHRVNGGYLVTGQWKYCSGATYATLFTTNCRLVNQTDRSSESIRAFTFMPDQVTITPDWNAFGLRATGSHSISVTDAFVQDEFVFDLSTPPVAYPDPIFSYPFLTFAEASFAGVTVGIGKHFLEVATQLTQQYKQAWEASQPGRFPFVQQQIIHHESTLEAVTNSFYQAVDESWALMVARSSVPPEMAQMVGDLARQATITAVNGAQQLFPHLGMSVVEENSVLNRTWRDLHTASQHTLLKAYPPVL